MKRWRLAMLTIVLALAFSMEQADLGVVQSLYGPISRSLSCSAVTVGLLTTLRGVTQAAMTPFVGAAGKTCNRIFLAMIGTLIWGITNIGIGVASTFRQAAAFAGLNGTGLALVLPCVQSILAEVYSAGRRGLAFGLVMTAGVLGQTIFNYVAISFGDRIIFGVQGWRLVFHILAGLAGITTALLFVFGLEPRTTSCKVKLRDETRQELRGRNPKNAMKCSASLFRQIYSSMKAMCQDCKKLFMVPSFSIILLAQSIAAVGASGTGYQILYIETIGFSDSDTAALSVFFSLGYAVGMVTGGLFGDTVAKRFSQYGRPFVNQLSIAVTAPLVAVYFKGLPGAAQFSNGVPDHMHKYLTLYSVVLFLVAVAAPMEQANNAAMYAEVIPEELRCSAYAFDRGTFGLLGAVAAPLAGILAKRVWGGSDLSRKEAPQPTPSEAQSFHALNIVNARALENANIAVIVGAIILRAVIYFALYWTLRQDTQALLRRQAAKSCDKDVPELTGVELLHLQQDVIGKAGHGRTSSFPGPCPKYRRDSSIAVRYASEPLMDHMQAPASVR